MSSALPSSPGPNPSPNVQYIYVQAGAPPPRVADARDRSAMERVKLAAILLLVAGLGDLVLLFGGSSFGASVPTHLSSANLALGPFGLYVGISAAFSVLTLIAYFVLRGGFLRFEDPTAFRWPSYGPLLIVASIPLLAGAAAVLYWDVLAPLLSCAGSATPIPTRCITPVLGPLGGALAFLVVGAIVALVGEILLLIGIWRLGARFGRGGTKAAAVLLIFPFLNVIGAILLWYDAREVIAQGPRP